MGVAGHQDERRQDAKDGADSTQGGGHIVKKGVVIPTSFLSLAACS